MYQQCAMIDYCTIACCFELGLYNNNNYNYEIHNYEFYTSESRYMVRLCSSEFINSQHYSQTETNITLKHVT